MAHVYIFEKDCEDFANFGLVGALTPTECTFEEEANGMSELTLVHPLDDAGRFAAIERECILMADVPVRTTPEIRGGKIVTSVEKWSVKATATKAQRTIYRRNTGSSRLKVIDAGAEVTVVERPSEGRLKVKFSKWNGWMEPDGLSYEQTQTIGDNSQSIESVQSAWKVKPQLFRIYKVDKEIDCVKAYARHISYDLLFNLTTFENAGSVSCGDALNGIMNGCVSAHEFSAYTNLEDARTGVEWTRVNPINALLDPETGLTARYSAALVRDNWELYILRDPGMNRGVTVEYAKNMTGMRMTESGEEIVTRIIPVGEKKDGSELLLDGTIWVDSPRINDYPIKHIQELKCENCKVGTDGVTVELARARMREQAQAVFENGGDLPEIQIVVEFISLGDTAEYAAYKDLDRLFLFDYVIIRHKRLDVDITARVVSIRWDCLRGRMERMEVGSVGKTLANSGINTWQIPTGISGGKIAGGTIGSGAIRSDAISTRHLQAESVNTEALQAGSVTSRNITANAVTTDKLAASSVTAEKLEAGSVDAHIVNAVAGRFGTIDAGNIETDALGAELARIAVLAAGTASFDRATIQHLVAQAMNLEYGTAGQVFIRNLAVEYAQMVGAAIGNLCIRASDGNYYRIDVQPDGTVSAERTTVSAGEIAAGQTEGGRVILETSITAANLSAGNLLATYALVNRIDAARMDVDALFAREAFVDLLRTSRIYGGKSIEMIVGNVDASARIFRQEDAPGGGDGVKNGDLWVIPSSGQTWQATALEALGLRFAVDGDGNLCYEIDGDAEGYALYLDGADLRAEGFAFPLDADGVPGAPYVWSLVRDAELEHNADAAANRANEALDIANAALSQADFQRVIRQDVRGLHVGDNKTGFEVLIDSASVNVMSDGEALSTFSDKYVRLDNMQIHKVRGGLAISVYNGRR